MVGCCPVTQTLQDHLLHHRVVTVHGIAAAAEIIIKALRRQHIVNIVVKALEGKTGTKRSDEPVILLAAVSHIP